MQYVLALIFVSGDSWYFSFHVTYLFFVLNSWLYLRAGYAFMTINVSATGKYFGKISDFFEIKKSLGAGEHISSNDVIVYIASLASSVKAIDSILDVFRIFTASHNGKLAASYTQEEQASLMRVYVQLEDYLIHKETLRMFTRDAIREEIEAKFGKRNLNQKTFWPLITTGVKI
jgi:hypothetical protein